MARRHRLCAQLDRVDGLRRGDPKAAANGRPQEENWRLAREELRYEAWSAAREAMHGG
jgi:hypothetical protein